MQPSKRQKLQPDGQTSRNCALTMPVVQQKSSSKAPQLDGARPKRVRTGCLTCRERHLRCDEGKPVCINCQRSERSCKRGVRLNFIDVQVRNPQSPKRAGKWQVTFQDESLQIAAEYVGGVDRYLPSPDTEEDVCEGHQLSPGVKVRDVSRPSVCTPKKQPNGRLCDHLQSDQVPPPPIADESSVASSLIVDDSSKATSRTSRSSISFAADDGIYGVTEQGNDNELGSRQHRVLTSSEEVRNLEAYMDHVAIWMDTMDIDCSFGQQVSQLALDSTMILNGLLACGAKHLASLGDAAEEEQALAYYDTANTQLLRNLQNPDRDMSECALTSVVLNACEIMCDKAVMKMKHSKGARALIKECGWSARSTGIGVSCFWVNIGIEVMTCLAFGWRMTWDPDDWGLDVRCLSRSSKLPFSGSKHNHTEGKANEMLWARYLLYILAKVANLKNQMASEQNGSSKNHSSKKQCLVQEWQALSSLCKTWHDRCPRALHPIGYVETAVGDDNVFPYVWLLHRSATVCRMLYHTALYMLTDMRPLPGENVADIAKHKDEITHVKQHHARQVCGIISTTKDEGVRSAALVPLRIIPRALAKRREREEVMQLLQDIESTSTWHLDHIRNDLIRAWEATDDKVSSHAAQNSPKREHTDAAKNALKSSADEVKSQRSSLPRIRAQDSEGHVLDEWQHPPTPSATLSPSIDSNPLSHADSRQPDHPYMDWYEPPNR